MRPIFIFCCLVCSCLRSIKNIIIEQCSMIRNFLLIIQHINIWSLKISLCFQHYLFNVTRRPVIRIINQILIVNKCNFRAQLIIITFLTVTAGYYWRIIIGLLSDIFIVKLRYQQYANSDVFNLYMVRLLKFHIPKVLFKEEN
jgi:hypothetical protein